MVKAKASLPPRPAVDIDSFIDGGGSSSVRPMEQPAAPPTEEEAKFTFRYSSDLKKRITTALKRMPGKVSLNTWLTMAALEKLERDKS